MIDLADQDALRNLATNAVGSQLILLPALTVPGAFSNSGLLSIGDAGDSFTTTTTFTQASTGTLGITMPKSAWLIVVVAVPSRRVSLVGVSVTSKVTSLLASRIVRLPVTWQV